MFNGFPFLIAKIKHRIMDLKLTILDID